MQEIDNLPKLTFQNGWAVFLTYEYAHYFSGGLLDDLTGAAERKFLAQAIDGIKKTISNQEALEQKANEMVKRLGFSSLKDYFNQATLNKNNEDKEDFMENYITDMFGPIQEDAKKAQKLRTQQSRYHDNFLSALDRVIDEYRNKDTLTKKDLENMIKKIKTSGEKIQEETIYFLEEMTELIEYIENNEILQARLKKELDSYFKHEQKQKGAPIDIKKNSAGKYQISIPKNIGTDSQRKTASRKLRKLYDEIEKNIESSKEYNSLIHTNKTKAEKNSENINKRIQWLINDAAKSISLMIEQEKTPSDIVQQNVRDKIFQSLQSGLKQNDETFEINTTKLRLNDKVNRAQYGGFFYEIMIQAKRQKLINKNILQSCIRREGEPVRRTLYTTAETTVLMNNDGQFFKTEDDILKAQQNILDFKKSKKKIISKGTGPNQLNKIDNYFEIGVLNESGEEDTLTFAFSEKLLNYKNLSQVSIVGEDASLLSSIDLLENNMKLGNNASNALVAQMLNLSTASVFYSEEGRKQMQDYLTKLLCSQFMELAFNANNFETSMEGMQNNVLYLMHASGGYVSAASVLKPLVNFLENADMAESIIQGEIKFDDAHSGEALYEEAVQMIPKRGARWNYVASQVAANTKINMTLNMAAIANLYMI